MTRRLEDYADEPNRAANDQPPRALRVGISEPGDEVLDDPVLAAVFVEDHPVLAFRVAPPEIVGHARTGFLC